ncbi:MAG: hypothetical protein ACRDPH_12520 [Marmoricola sp.]
MADRVVLHVGTPKTGTSAVQDALFNRRDQLAKQEVLYPGDRFDAHFLAALDLMELPWGGLEQQSAGAWDRLADEVRDWSGTAIISHEILGRASRLQAARALESLGGSGAEMHVVVSARDLARQLPAEWQENVKHRRTLTYHEFLDRIRDPERSAEISQWFWSVQEVPDVLARWADTLPPDRVHVVTVPPSGSDPDLLARRFADALGLAEIPSDGSRSNVSLGVAESALVRRLNERLDMVLPNHHYREFVRELLVHRNLSLRRESPRLTVPEEVHDWTVELGRQWADELAARQYAVVGDLDDLVPAPQQLAFADPDAPDEAEVAAAGVRALAASVTENARLRDVEAELRGVVDDLRGQLDAVYSTRAYRIKQRLVASADHNPVARAGLGGYRLLRGRSSRSA